MTGQEPAPGSLGNYRVLRRLGEGGMGVVYLAADPQDRLVAVKALRQGVSVDPNARYRLAREVETMRRVHSPFVAEVLDADVTSEPPYIVTRYVQGRSLEDVVAESGPLAGEALARLAYGLASALTAVHAAGVVHRDLKPGNVMLADGKPVVIDFGIAQAPDLTRLTMTGMFMGTPGYLAPEVIEGKQSGPAADVHSWGATVAFAATGRPPFGIGSFETIFYRIVHGQPDLDRFPPPLAPLVVDALARDPARRPSAGDLRARLAALDPASLVPGAALSAAAAQPPPGTVMDYRGAAARAPGAGQAPAAQNGHAAAAASEVIFRRFAPVVVEEIEQALARHFLFTPTEHLSQTRIGAATCIAQGRVSEIIRGNHEVRTVKSLDRIAWGLGMPDTARVVLGLAPSSPVPAAWPAALSALPGASLVAGAQ